MSDPPLRWSGRGYWVFLAALGSVVVLLAGIGAVVASMRNDGSLPAILAALGVVAFASAVSGILIAFSGGSPTATMTRALLAMLIRLALVAGLAAVCVLALKVARGPFLIWLVIAYLALLAVDTIFSVRGPGRSG